MFAVSSMPTTSITCKSRLYTSKGIHYNISWGQELSFSVPSCLDGHDRSYGSIVRILLSNHSRVKFSQEHLLKPEENAHSEIWVPSTGSRGDDNIHLLLRLVYTGEWALQDNQPLTVIPYAFNLLLFRILLI